MSNQAKYPKSQRNEMKHLDEGDACPDIACTGTMQFRPVENCSCHISPPCLACTSNPLVCSECGKEASQFSDADLYVSDACMPMEQPVEAYSYSRCSHFGAEPECAIYEDASYLFWGNVVFPDDFGTLQTSIWLNPYCVNWRHNGLKSTHFTMCKEVSFPPYMTQDAVRKQVVGTFGGRFEAFDQKRGTFTYIAYTD